MRKEGIRIIDRRPFLEHFRLRKDLPLKSMKNIGFSSLIAQAFDIKCDQLKINFLIFQPKCMLWVLKRTVSVRQY